MSRAVVVRVLETFFRRWWLYLLPLALLTAVGVRSAVNRQEIYRSSGTLYVESETFLSSLTSVRDGNIGWQTPASHFDQQLSGLLQTDAFLSEVASTAGIDPAHYPSSQMMMTELRSAISTWPSGENLVLVAASHRAPEEARDLATAVVDRFVQWQIDSDVDGSSIAERFFADLIASYEESVVTARATLEEYLVEHPEPVDGGMRPLAQRLAIERLTDAVDQGEQRLEEGRAKEEEARLATAQAESDVLQRLRVMDVPEVPTMPEPAMRKAALELALFAGMGLVLSAGALLAATVLDRSVRTRFDIAESFGRDVLAVVPEQRRRRARWRRQKVAPA